MNVHALKRQVDELAEHRDNLLARNDQIAQLMLVIPDRRLEIERHSNWLVLIELTLTIEQKQGWLNAVRNPRPARRGNGTGLFRMGKIHGA